MGKTKHEQDFCEWFHSTYDSDNDCGLNTSCDNETDINDDPIDIGWVYCPYCRLEIKVVRDE